MSLRMVMCLCDIDHFDLAIDSRCVAVCGLGDVRYLVQRVRAGGGWWSALNFGLVDSPIQCEFRNCLLLLMS